MRQEKEGGWEGKNGDQHSDYDHNVFNRPKKHSAIEKFG